MEKPVWKKRIGIFSNGDFFSIEIYTGYRISIADPEFMENLLPPDIPNSLLGDAVVEALANSRPMSFEESESLRVDSQKHYEDWVKLLMEKYGYKTRRALFKNMKYCGLCISDGS